MFGFLTKIFGTKSERDVKGLVPYVEQIKIEYAKLQSISDDELRGKSFLFRNRIKEHLSAIDLKIENLQAQASEPNLGITTKIGIYENIDKLKKDRDKSLEEILIKILPEAYAVIKETSRRLSENKELRVTATDFDRELASKKANVIIDGNIAIHKNTWMAAGSEITWNMVHYDVQMLGGTVLHQGKIAEMATGEGKTLVGSSPAYLNALAGQGVHIVTVNDYLARRDSEWMGPLYEFHCLSVDCVDEHQPGSDSRKKAYLADITFGTNNEFGFDYLRDNMARSANELVQRKLHFAMVDEVDSVLVDDARTPLIISGPVPKGDQHEFTFLKPRIESLVEKQKTIVNRFLTDAKRLLAEQKIDEAGVALFRAYRGLPKNKALIKLLSEQGVRQLLQKTEAYFLQDQQKEMPVADEPLLFVIDEKSNSIDLTEKGIAAITASGEDSSFFILPNVGSEIAKIEKSDLSVEEKTTQKDNLMRDFSIKSERIHSINQLLKAYTLFEKNVEYILDEGKVKIVDEQTGRIMDGRRYSDGLHQAIEAKENVKIEDATQTFATITLQNYFRMYHKLCGMTGTATTEAGELWQIYKLDVVEIPTNRKILRKDHEDLVFKTAREKYNAVVDEIVKLTAANRPVLVGTTSVEISELLSRMLKLRNIKHNVLNAKLHQKEADIVAEAGKAGTVTIATNMAGRGTDIKLGEGVKEAGGLAIIGTERHDSRRVDRQLRGRAGRQGDPGSSQFFVSLQDDLMRLFGSERIASIMDKMGLEEGDVIQHSMITKSIERAQRKVEENNFGTRKRLLEYDDVMNLQRTVIYAKRHNALFGERLDVDIDNIIFDTVEELIMKFREERNFEGFKLEMLRLFVYNVEETPEQFLSSKATEIVSSLYQKITAHYRTKSENIANIAFPVIKDVYENKGDQVETVQVPFNNGSITTQVAVNLKKAYETNGMEIIKAFERSLILHTIDDAWREHLRMMDELKQSVQNAVYEQKDPLLVYKFESFELFKQRLISINHEIIDFLFKGAILVREKEAPKPQPKYYNAYHKYQSNSTADVNNNNSSK